MDDESPINRTYAPLIALRAAIRAGCGAELGIIYLDRVTFLTLRDAEGDYQHIPEQNRPDHFTVAGVEIHPLPEA